VDSCSNKKISILGKVCKKRIYQSINLKLLITNSHSLTLVQVGFDHPLNEQRCLERIDAHDGSFGEPDTNRTCSGSEQLERTQDLLFNFTYGQEVDPVPFRTSVIKYKETQSNLSLSKCKENFVSPD
jgi:hypothetical protein